MSPELKKRVLTGLIGGLALVSLLWFGGKVGTLLFVLGLSIGMIIEFSQITLSLPDRIEKRYVLLILGWIVTILSFLMSQIEYLLLILSFLSLFVYYLVAASRHEGPHFTTHFYELVLSEFAVLYLVFLPLFLLRIAEMAEGRRWILFFLLLNWSGDSAAYFAGKKYGKRKLYPKISPKKTVEGALAGIGAGWLVAIVCRLTFFPSLRGLELFLIPVLIGAVSQAGDLCESFFKRSFHTKDSGSILPGHGGFLDRFDGVVFSLPVMYACIRLFG